jgi:hypothetical protein
MELVREGTPGTGGEGTDRMFTALLCVTSGFPSVFAEPPTESSKKSASALFDPNQFALNSRASDILHFNRKFEVPYRLPERCWISSRMTHVEERLRGKSPAEVAFLLGERAGNWESYYQDGRDELVWYRKSGLTVHYSDGRASNAWNDTITISPSELLLPVEPAKLCVTSGFPSVCVTSGFPSVFAEPPADSSKTSALTLLDPNQFTLDSRASDILRINREFEVKGRCCLSRRDRYVYPIPAVEQLVGKSPAEVAFLLGESECGQRSYDLSLSGEIVWYWKSGRTVFYVAGCATIVRDDTTMSSPVYRFTLDRSANSGHPEGTAP